MVTYPSLFWIKLKVPSRGTWIKLLTLKPLFAFSIVIDVAMITVIKFSFNFVGIYLVEVGMSWNVLKINQESWTSIS